MDEIILQSVVSIVMVCNASKRELSPAVERHRYRQEEGHGPNPQQENQQRALGPHSLGQEGPGDGQPAVQAHQTDQVDGDIHVDAGQVVHQLAGCCAKLPTPPTNQVAQKEGSAEQHEGIGQSQVEHQQAGDRALLYPAQHGPDHKQVSRKAQQEGQGQDGHAHLLGDPRGGWGGGRPGGQGSGGGGVGLHGDAAGGVLSVLMVNSARPVQQIQTG